MTEPARFTYHGNQTREISFPLGGIGTGAIGLSGSGRLVDWEIFNRPNKGSLNGFSHFAIRAEKDGRVLDARVLNGDLHPPYSGENRGSMFSGFGFGPARESLAGLPHFHQVNFIGQFPLAELEFNEPKFPAQVRLLAFNPFIPLNDFDSSLPAAFFAFTVTNTSAETLTYTLAGTLSNPLNGRQVHTVYEEDGGAESRCFLHLRATELEAGALDGDLTLALQGKELSAQEFWFRGAWFDSLEVYWREFSARTGALKPRSYAPEAAGRNNSGSLATRFTLTPGASREARLVISWSFPWVENNWNPASNEVLKGKGQEARWRNFYASKFENSFSSAQYALEHWDKLLAQTRRFTETLYSSSLPRAAMDAVGANLAVLKSPTVLRLPDGEFYGFEGCHAGAGCCEGSCTHVWNYAQAAPFLFPALERSMRSLDFTLNQRADGAMRFRLPLPAILDAGDYWTFHPCVDGQFGNVLKAYADWKISGDGEWLRKHWPAIRRSIDFAWAESNEYRWDPGKTGVISGRQHHTLDMELFSPSSWLNGFYLAALKAGAEMADALGEAQVAAEYRAIFARGKAWTDTHLFNGEYYEQKIDLTDQSLLSPFEGSGAALTGSVMQSYWNPEHGEIKYQIGTGCEIDQLLAQWHANLYGLGEIFDPAQALSALRSLHKYNFKPSLREYANPCRVFALNDEAGLVMCEWPEGKQKPVIPIPYSQEVMTGFEYAAAILMIQSGLIEEGMSVVRAIRARYDGEKRNPWNEIECGSNYARSMASYGLLLTFSGFEFDMPRGMVGFNPIPREILNQRYFWCVGDGWGEYRQTDDNIEIEVLFGSLSIQYLRLRSPERVKSILADGKPAPFRLEKGEIAFETRLRADKFRVILQ